MTIKRSLIPNDVTFIERDALRSGGIINNDNRSLKFGVVYTTHEGDREPDPTDFDTNSLLNATIFNPHNPNGTSDEDRTFTIVGGYFFNRKDNPEGRTTQVFGVAEGAEFGITEDGSTIIGDNWIHEDGENNNRLKEREIGRADKGWTFIVQEFRQPRDLYPSSNNPFELFVLCPELTGLTCQETKLDGRKQTIKFTAEIEGQRNFLWTFDDLIDDQQSSTNTIEREFVRPWGGNQNFTATVATQAGSDFCSQFEQMQETQCSLTGICPIIDRIECIPQDVTDDPLGKKQTFTCELHGFLLEEPELSFRWELSNGDIFNTNEPRVTLEIERPDGDDIPLNLNVKIEGAGDCEVQKDESIQVAGRCPVIDDFICESIAITEEKETFEFRLTLDLESPTPSEYEWTLGNIPPFTTTDPITTAEFDRPIEEDLVLPAKVVVKGPGTKCSTEADKDFTIKKRCPRIIDVSAESELEERTHKFTFTKKIEGPAPDKCIWDWGDGQTEELPGETVIHSYDRLPGGARDLNVKLTIMGPGDCMDMYEIPITVEGLCPEIFISNQEQSQERDTVEVEVNVDSQKATPDGYIVDWGDGTIDGTKEALVQPPFTHSYNRKPGEDQTFVAVFLGCGPDSCEHGVSDTFEVKGYCPLVDGDLKSSEEKTVEELILKLQLDFFDILPHECTIDWGDGSASETLMPGEEASHPYERKFEGDQNYTALVTCKGPGNCPDIVLEHSVDVPARCPIITNLNHEKVREDDTSITFLFSADIRGLKPTTCNWKLDENTTVSACDPFEHTYVKQPGDDRKILISLETSGPQDCTDSAEKEITIPGICPRLTITDIEEIPERTKTKFKIDINAELTTPDTYEVDWGDGTIDSVTNPPFEHEYMRLPGLDKVYMVTIKGTGPESCHSEVKTPVNVQKYCPLLTGDPTRTTELLDEKLKVGVTILFEDILPDSCEIDWADGSPVEPITPGVALFHEYRRKSTGDETYPAIILCKGPGSCPDLTIDCPVNVPGLCPVITNISKEIVGQSKTELTVKFTAVFSGEKPDTFTWDFGDGNVKSSPDESISHTYQRPEGDDETYVVNLTTEGPSQCASQESTECPVPGVCPVIMNIQKETLEVTNEIQKVKITAVIAGPVPDNFIWDFGDGSTEQSTTPEIIHDFSRPGGDDKVYTIILNTTGPDQCNTSHSVQYEVEGICSVVSKIEVNKGTAQDSTQEVNVKLEMMGPSPESYRWNWGDGSPEEITNVSEATHVYNRPLGDNEIYQISVNIIGPENCRTTASSSVEIEGICPKVEALNLVSLPVSGIQQSVVATLVVKGPAPDKYIWDCGQGKDLVETTVPTYTCEYDRPAGDNILVPITVSLEGPGSCLCSVTEEVEIPGLCPEAEVDSIETVRMDKDIQEVKVSLVLTGDVSPNKYKWDWGDGRTLETLVPEASHTYQRPPGDDKEYPVTITLEGPDSCLVSLGAVASVKGVCPTVTSVKPVVDTPAANTQNVCITLTTDGPTPRSYLWDWGDGNTDTTTEAQACHTYNRPLGKDVKYMVKVTVSGPGSCSNICTTLISIEGICPSVQKISPTYEQTSDTLQSVKVALDILGPIPTKYLWDWGDGSQISETTVPEARHNYVRTEGDDGEYTAMVKLDGPDTCDTIASVLITIPGICPEIMGIEFQSNTPANSKQLVTATAMINGPQPSTYTWDWGDGTIDQTSEATATHEYDQPAGIDKTYEVVLTTQGPGNCSHSFEKELVIPKACPEINDLITTLETPKDDTQHVRAEVLISGPPPVSYIWNWGDGSKPQQTPVHYATHEYPRPDGDDKKYCITVYSQGPGECSDSYEKEVSIEGICPKITQITATVEPPQSTTQKVRVEVSSFGPVPEKYIWAVGNMDPVETTVPWIERIFDRPQGEDKKYPIKVDLIGPASCHSSGTTDAVIKGICPSIEKIVRDYGEPTDTMLPVTLTIEKVGPEPNEITWDWGDGAIETNNKLTHTHYYRRPDSADQTYDVELVVKGPGSCQCYGSVQITVPGSCPQIDNVSTKFGTLKEDEQEVAVTIQMDTTGTETFIWDWGDGSDPEDTTTNVHKHIYKRGGLDKSYTLTITSMGPGNCTVDTCVAINIKGTCPQISTIYTNYGIWEDNCQTIKFRVITQGGEHESFRWDWGDGSSVETTDSPVNEHTFKNTNSDKTDYQVTVAGAGPDPDDKECENCESTASIDVTIPGACPIILSIKKIKGNSSDDKQKYTFVAITRGPDPAEYHWEIVGQTEEITEIPNLDWEFDRVPSDDRIYEIKLTIKSKADMMDCEDQFEDSITIPKSEP